MPLVMSLYLSFSILIRHPNIHHTIDNILNKLKRRSQITQASLNIDARRILRINGLVLNNHIDNSQSLILRIKILAVKNILREGEEQEVNQQRITARNVLEEIQLHI